MESKKTIKWQAPEYIPQKKGNDWFWAVGIITLSASATAVILNNVLLGILILVAIGVLVLYTVREPEIVKIEVEDKGVSIDKRMYTYEELDSFWIDTESYSDRDVLILKPQKFLMIQISVIISEEVDLDELREKLAEHLKEEELDEGLPQKIMEFFGF